MQGADQEGKMIRVNGWTNHMEKIGNKEYHVSVDSYKNYLVKIYNGAEIFPSQTVTFGDLGKVESFLNEEARKSGNERRFRGTYEWGGSKK